ncbi:MAG: type II toxin-antitoxin system PemK/MazF family toxin [Deltaproteobacteria bacterium]|nr:type II toxin-antitoxin system PemK/MazF family toxin [Deltaproteobacteria bacterium]
MRSTTTFDRGQVVVVNVPFSSQAGAKLRPALIVSTSAFHRRLPDVVVCPVSSQPRRHERPGPGDQPLENWRAVGLRHPSTVRISNIVAVDKRLIRRVLGTMSPSDVALVERGLRAAFGL